MFAFFAFFPNQSYATEYEMVLKDTLWDLASENLRSPWDWPFITNMDGSQVENVYSIPEGYKVWIPEIDDIAHLPIPFETAGAPQVVISAQKRIKADVQNSHNRLKKSAHIKKIDLVSPDQPNITNISKTSVSNPYHYLFVNKKDGLVRAYIDGQHVTIPVSKLVELYANANPGLDVKKIGDGIAISKNLIKEMLGLKKRTE